MQGPVVTTEYITSAKPMRPPKSTMIRQAPTATRRPDFGIAWETSAISTTKIASGSAAACRNVYHHKGRPNVHRPHGRDLQPPR